MINSGNKAIAANYLKSEPQSGIANLWFCLKKPFNNKHFNTLINQISIKITSIWITKIYRTFRYCKQNTLDYLKKQPSRKLWLTKIFKYYFPVIWDLLDIFFKTRNMLLTIVLRFCWNRSIIDSLVHKEIFSNQKC